MDIYTELSMRMDHFLQGTLVDLAVFWRIKALRRGMNFRATSLG